MAPRPTAFPIHGAPALVHGALAIALAASGVASCHDVGLYPLQSRLPDDGGSEPVDLGTPMDTGEPTDAGPSDSAMDMPVTLTCPNVPVAGYATLTAGGVDGGPPQVGTTGGGNAKPQVPMNYDTLAAWAMDATPRVIEVMGIITFPPVQDGGAANKQQIRVASNKTIVGADMNSGLSGGGLFIDGSRNVIVRNLKISGAFQTDAITIQASTNVWVDHCDLSCDPDPTLMKMCDGLVDVTHASDYVTVSWTYYHDHNASGLVGGSDNNGAEDMNHLTVTYHHNFFTNVFSGPRIRFGQVHVFNNYFSAIGDYAVGSTLGAQVYIERNVFDGVPLAIPNPITTMVSTSMAGQVAEGTFDRANVYIAPTAQADNVITTTPASYLPPYGYSAVFDLSGSVQALDTLCTGVGKVTPLPIPTN